jgi:uncharacterized protein HemX
MRNKNKKSRGFSGALIVALLVAVIGGYIFVVNNMTVKGFKMRELENKVQTLKDQNEKFKLIVTESQAVTNIKEKISSTNMVPVDKYDYLEAADTAMAKK